MTIQSTIVTYHHFVRTGYSDRKLTGMDEKWIKSRWVDFRFSFTFVKKDENRYKWMKI